VVSGNENAMVPAANAGEFICFWLGRQGKKEIPGLGNFSLKRKRIVDMINI
jgi:hypothetical protein